MSKVMSLVDAALLIPDGAVDAVSSSSGLQCPDASLRAIGERFERTGSPKDMPSIYPIAAGDMDGIDGIDHLARPGLLKRVIAGSSPSGPSSMPSPKIWRMINDDEVEAYNLPSGILYHLHVDAAAKRPGVLTKVGLDTFVDPRRHGGRMNARTTEELVRVVELDGDEWLYVRALPIDGAIVRGTTADEDGNLSMEHEGAFLGALDQALAARHNGGVVIAQVERVVAAGSIPTQQVRLPGNPVDVVVVDPDQMQTTETCYDPAISGEIRVPESDFEPTAWGTEKVIARQAAMALRVGEAVNNLGFGISALVPRVLLEEGHGDDVIWVIEQGTVGGVPLLGFAFGCAANAATFMPSPLQFAYLPAGGCDGTCLSFMQVGADGSVNVSKLAEKPHVTAGAGGFADITANAQRIVFAGYLTAGGLQLDLADGRLTVVADGRSKKVVPDVEHVTFSGPTAVVRGAEAIDVTERAVLTLTLDGLEVTKVAPGVDLNREVLGQMAIPAAVSRSLTAMDAGHIGPEPRGPALERRPSRRSP